MLQPERDTQDESIRIPSRGERIELARTRTGIRVRGTVFYSDQVQILVKWDNGASGNLRIGRDRFFVIDDEARG